MKQSTRFLYLTYGSRRHFVEAFGPAVKCKTKAEALKLEEKLNKVLRAHDRKQSGRDKNAE